jgi:hypothetical protein
MSDADEMTETGSAQAVPGIDWDALDARLASAASGNSDTALPAYRRIWFVSLIRQGREAEAQGRAGLAAHCLVRLEQEFKVFGIAGLSAHSDRAQDVLKTDDAGHDHDTDRSTRTVRTEKTSDAAALSTKPSPLKALAARREVAARARLRELLDRHDFRLSSDEAAAFRQALDGSGESTGGIASISDLRRRLVDRLMRAARYRRHAQRLAAWKPTPAEGVSGPYNDYRALEDMLHRVAAANPHAAEWAAEFFDIYADMRGVRLAYGTVLPGK